VEKGIGIGCAGWRASFAPEALLAASAGEVQEPAKTAKIAEFGHDWMGKGRHRGARRGAQR
jgi:hypothetical protein